MISGLILAAGFSSRMEGKNKLLLEIKGKLIIEHVIIAAQKSKLDEIVLVYKDEAVNNIAKSYGLRTIYNESSSKGMSTSLAKGLGIVSKDSKACLFLLGDMPFVSAETINKIIDTHKNISISKDYDIAKQIVVPFYKEERGNPVMIGSSYYSEILNNSGDIGARDIIKKNKEYIIRVDIINKEENIDVDTPEKYMEINKFDNSTN